MAETECTLWNEAQMAGSQLPPQIHSNHVKEYELTHLSPRKVDGVSKMDPRRTIIYLQKMAGITHSKVLKDC